MRVKKKENKTNRIHGGSGWADAIFRGNANTPQYACKIFSRYNSGKYELVLKRKGIVVLYNKEEMFRMSYTYIEQLRGNRLYGFDEVCKHTLI